MNEAETRAELIDPKLAECGWGVVDGSRVRREYNITAGRIQAGGRGKREIADYVLEYRGVKLAVIEAKSALLDVGEGVMQAKKYADKLALKTTFSTNGKDIYQICMETGQEGFADSYPTPDELWEMTFATGDDAGNGLPINNHIDEWRKRFASVPFDDKGGAWQLRYYQEIAVQRTLDAIAQGRRRILLTLATGTGKTAIAVQAVWKLFHTRWNLSRLITAINKNTTEVSDWMVKEASEVQEIYNKEQKRRPRILFLADRNILADQAFNSFSSFPEDALVRIKPSEIRKKGGVPTNGSIFFTIFQTFMSGADGTENSKPYFGEYPRDFFDLIIIDECHRGGADNESTWRGILEYFNPAVQVGLTATPRREDNVDTYSYFGDPVYVYSLKDGINDGFLTPFKVKRIQTTLDDYRYTPDDMVMDGFIEEGKLYEEKDFNRSIEIIEREKKRVQIYLDDASHKEKGIVFCANQPHAALIRDLINQNAKSKNPFYCVRVTANDGEEGERQLREFQDNEKTIPTILTTSYKLSTGVDARNIRNIVLMREIGSMVEFKQIVGRGTRLYDGKEFFTIYDYVGAYKHFSDPEWDGTATEEVVCKRCGNNPCVCETVLPEPCAVCGEYPCVCENPDSGVCAVCGMSPCVCEAPNAEPCERCGQQPCICPKKVKVKLGKGKEREIQHMISTSFWSADGKPISSEEFLNSLFGELPKLFKDEQELRKLWSNPLTRKQLLSQLEDAGFPADALKTVQQLVNMENSDLFDVLNYIFNGDYEALTREARGEMARKTYFLLLSDKQQEFISFVMEQYIKQGVSELGEEKLSQLLLNKYQSLPDALNNLGGVDDIRKLFFEFQKHLYDDTVA